MAARKTQRSAFEDACAMIARRELTTHELSERLTRREHDPCDVAEAVQRAVDARLVDDRRYAEAFVRVRRSRGYGAQRIRRDMHTRGLSDELVDDAFTQTELDAQSEADSEAPSELDRCSKMLHKRFSTADLSDPRIRQRATGYLVRRGYDWQTIHAAMAAHGSD